MKARGVILSICAMMVFFASYACANEPEPIQPSSAKPVMVPYLNKNINEVTKYEYESDIDGNQQATVSDRVGSVEDFDTSYSAATLKNAGTVEGGEVMSEAMPELVESEPDESSAGGTEDPVLTPLGVFTITFYCPCEICCGEWATGCTASGVLATEWHTVATGERFPFGTRLYIDGLGYFTVEDRGVDDNCIDVFVNDHDEALNYGLQYMDVYLVED